MSEGVVLAKDFANPDDVPELVLLDEEKILVASGQHRYSAIHKYHQSLQDEIAANKKRIVRIEEMKTLTKAHVDEHDDLRQSTAELLGQVEGLGKWGVVIYDQGKWSIYIIDIRRDFPRTTPFRMRKYVDIHVIRHGYQHLSAL